MKTKITILLFLYVYPLFFMGIPLSSRVIFGVLGCAFFILQKVHNVQELRPLFGLLPIMGWSLLVGSINETYDFFFISYGISMLLIYFASFFIVNRVSILKTSRCAIDVILSAFILVVIIQSFIAILFYLFPAFQNICYKIFPLTEKEMSTAEGTIGFRFLGLGSCFFGAGVIHGFALLTMGYLYIADKVKSKTTWILSYLLILFAGLMFARTTVIGFGLSLLLIFSWKPFSKKTIKRNLVFILCFFAIMGIAIILLVKYVDESLLRFAFEFFYNYNETGSFESASTNQLQEMYGLPTELWTYIVGDGLYNLKSGGYYMSTDVGYMRLLYYGGIPMIVFYFYYQWYLLNNIIKIGSYKMIVSRKQPSIEMKNIINFGITKYLKRFLYFSFVYLLILNVKGFTDFSIYYMLFFSVLYNNIKTYKNYNGIRILRHR